MATPADIVVRRCAVRVVRHGGWSWGPQPQRLVDQVLAALPSLIAARLGDLAPDGAPDVEITEPVRLVVSLTLEDLLAGRFDPLRHVAMAAQPPVELSTVSGPARPMAPVRSGGMPLLEHRPPVRACAPDVTLTQFLARLVERGELDHFLALLPADTLEAWYQLLAVSPADATGTIPRAAVIPAVPPDVLPGGTGYQVSEPTAQSPGAAAFRETGRSRRLRDAISAIAARVSRQTAAASFPPAGPAAGFHDRQAPVGPASASRPPLHAGASSASAASAGTASATLAASTGHVSSAPGAVAPAHATSAPAAAGDVDIASVLPFLLLSPLVQVGYLSALKPTLQPVGLESQTAAFATALAYTVLAPLERAWRRQPEDLAAAAAFAGLAAPVPGPSLTEFARVASPALPALDAVVTRALAEGHTTGEPLVLAAAEGRTDGGLLLVDREGLFPIAWTDTVAGFLPAWRMCGSPPVLVAPAAAGALRGLAAADVSFVVATPPARDERWRRLRPHRLWTNSHDDPALARHASSYRQAVDLAGELIQALAGDRAAVPLAASPALGRSLLLAAGLGLGTLAWTLWGEREPTDPLLTLERLADLSARVSFEPHRVLVRLPLGPRHADLSAHGLLANVRGVPWFGGRVVEFSGG